MLHHEMPINKRQTALTAGFVGKENQEVRVANIVDAIGSDGVFVVRLLVAMVLGGLVGKERQTRGGQPDCGQTSWYALVRPQLSSLFRSCPLSPL